ncbi:hypothetical protein BY996DRAFT_512315 [Phakopsora pachyrhizi]|uniref:Expressed protein n=1 Tax=Phakopsora pachyrhizi TaxID=170000 RepID=A0AAV0AE44_PHAPC|nr:hypothetical protein BY996DRAFT_512315 [Phakopsora pachyrhizi]CAH7665863.1 expressed protein [Phakopsora pachyrhizi]
MIISIIKCICQSPKFANPKDYPNGFPWEVRASRILTGNGRINSGGRRSQLSPLDTGMGRPNPSAKRDWSKFKNQRTLAPSPIRTSLQGYRSAPLTPSPQYERKDYSFDGQTSTVELYYMNSSNNNEMSKKWEESPAYLSSRAPSSSTPSATDDGSCESHRDELDTPPLQPALMRGISLKDEYFKNVQRVSFHDLEYNRGAQIEKQ